MNNQKQPNKFEVVMHAERTADCYGGDDGDKIIPQWKAHAGDDMDEEESTAPLKLLAKHFPPGTIIEVKEPVCPVCDQVGSICMGQQKAKSKDPTRCSFDWKQYTLDQYS